VTGPTRIGRYAIYDAIASGGMARVHFGKFSGPGGFARTVAVKRLHPHLAKDPEFSAMFVDEARLAAWVRHPNVVATLDVLTVPDELLIVMEYVHGESLSDLLRLAASREQRVPPAIACAVVVDLLAGLHAAHEATDPRGQPLGIVHRDVSPHNVLVAADGVARVLDFGVAKAIGRLQVTREGHVKGKIAYMAPEQVRGQTLGPAVDVYAAGVVLWETLTARRLFDGKRDGEVVEKILYGAIEAPAAVEPRVPEELNDIALRALSRDPGARFATARDMARAITRAVRRASASEVGDWVESLAGDTLRLRAEVIAAIDRDDTVAPAPGATIGGSAVATTPQLPAVAEPARGRRRPAILAVALVAVAVSGALVVRSRAGAWAPAPAAPGSDTPAPDPSATWLEEAGAPGLAASPVVSLPAATASPAAGVGAGLQHAGVQPQRTGAPALPRRPPQAAPAGCDPPYTIDREGTRHYKLNCL
jgi:hypothetical protein